jgi:hypothetical protein
MVDHVANRDKVIAEIRKELVGPSPSGEPIEISPAMRFTSWEQFNGPYYQADNGEEILIQDSPSTRYGIGVLYPQRVLEPEESDAIESPAALLDTESLEHVPASELDSWDAGTPKDRPSSRNGDNEDELDLSKANSFKPSTMAVSFRARVPDGCRLEVNATGGRYKRQTVEVLVNSRRSERDWWLRIPIEFTASISAEELKHPKPKIIRVSPSNAHAATAENVDPIELSIEILSRPTSETDVRLFTVSLVNRSSEEGFNSSIEKTLFQSHMRASIKAPNDVPCILPYPFPPPRQDQEQLGQDMLYRNVPVFATGHGCSADWTSEPKQALAHSVSAESLPEVELKPTTPDIVLDTGDSIAISMRDLASLDVGTETWSELEALIQAYESWIHKQEAIATNPEFPEMYKEVGSLHLAECKNAATRMKQGLSYLKDTPDALRAFRYANEAMVIQQVASRSKARGISFDATKNKIAVAGKYVSPFETPPQEGRGTWRPFQIAFLLASVESAGDPESADRDAVDLIWFPTGGGKTEAYLGLAAFSMFFRRLRNPQDVGVNVIMRYTLRLLTTQQFERAASLICAMNQIRLREGTDLGYQEFSIGVWVGGETTPNTREQALSLLNDLQYSWNTENPFLINKCPWCGTTLGKAEIPIGKKKKKKKSVLVGYKREATGSNVDTIKIHCPDDTCPYHPGLPLYVIDEDIYDKRPSIVIGTIDKFANLAWRSDARAIFGIDPFGEQTASPPHLIIQDELHLITGPLGSLAGLFEPVVENLCTDFRQESPIKPKIICATATTRRYKEQIRGLYGRMNARLFPPPGINADDSFFARTDNDARGKKYLGVHAPGFGSYQTEWVRSLAGLVHAPMSVATEERDPWWTLLLFCNSLRDMGTAHTLLDTDVRDYSQVFWSRNGTPPEGKRYLSNILELTGGLKRSEIREAIDALETTYPPAARKPNVDVCLATNIIEVGVDIQRLSLMAVAGQPKTTAQYIQATGRVGRDPEKPGLVVTLYGPSKPRDRSHFERFRGYHERLYAQVEPSSVTPFSSPALHRALHAAIVAYVRQKGGPEVTDSPYPPPDDLIDEAIRIIKERAETVDKLELETLDRVAARRRSQWHEWERLHWDKAQGEDPPLLRTAGAYTSTSHQKISWPTMRSMRNVDSECHGWISDSYNRHATMDVGESDE